MPGAIITKQVRAADGSLLTMRLWDESGAGTGPYSFFTILGADGVKLAKKEDDASAGGDEGIVWLAKRLDSPANSSTTDGDYEPPQMSGGYLWTKPGATEVHLGEVGGKTVVFDWTPSCHTGANTAGDIVAATEQLNGALRITNGTGIIQSLTLIDVSDQKADLDIWFFSANQSIGTEDSPPDIDDTEVLDVLGRIRIEDTDYYDLGGASVATISNIGLAIKAVSGTDDLYAAITTAGTPTYGASGLKLRIGVLLD